MSALATSISWIGASLTGTIATAIATVAVGAIGLQLLAGRISIERAWRTLLGCFLIFGAPLLAAAFNGMPPNRDVLGHEAEPAMPMSPPLKTSDDPYAGASVMTR